MKSLLPQKQIPAWQLERAKKLHRACLRVQEALQQGELPAKAFRRVARNFNHRIFKSSPTRRMNLCAGTLRRLFKAWQRNAQLPSAFPLNFKPRRASLPVAVLVRFVEYCADTRHESQKEAWQKFCARSGRGGRSGKPVKISLGQVYYFFPASAFYQLQAHQKAIRHAEEAKAALRLNTITALRARIPDRVKPSTQNPQPEFEI